MPIMPTDSDIGRRVIYAPASKTGAAADRMFGTLARLWDGIPYIKYDWQPQGAPPIPESLSLLSWDDDAPLDGATASFQPEDSDSPLIDAPTVGAMMAEDDLGDSLAARISGLADADDADVISAGGGSFGGGGATADWSDPTPDSDTETDTSTDDSDSGGSDE